MSELAMTVLRLSYLALLWIFVWAAISVLRKDLYSVTRVTPRGRGRAAAADSRGRRGRGRGRARGSRGSTGTEPSAPSPTPVPIGGTGHAPNLPPRAAGNGGRPPSRVRLTAGKMAGTSLPLGRCAIVVGRAQSCTLVLDDDYASSRHARFFPQGDVWFVEDLGSTNGTFVNGQRIGEPIQLGVGEVVQIGQSSMELVR